jgi:hypothetical protein
MANLGDQEQRDDTDGFDVQDNLYDYQDGDDGYFGADPNQLENQEISWQASEYIHHDKSPLWSVGLGLIAVAVAGALFFILRDYSIDVLVLVMSVAVYIYGNRQPQTLSYTLSLDGLQIGEDLYSFNQFRSFSIMQEDGLFSIELLPLQRYKPALSIYFAPQDGDRIVDVLSAFLPLEEKVPDYVDRFVKKIRF